MTAAIAGATRLSRLRDWFTSGSATLERVSKGHDNNLNLLRVLAALLVLLSHSYTVATGNSALEPGRAALGMSLGDISVDVFFVISGFLVAKSIFRSGSLRKYAAARMLRILPGLWVSLLLTVVVVETCFSSHSLARNLADPDTWRYLWKNAIPVSTPEFSLPGAFSSNIYPFSVNASLWTLPLEVWMYILLAAAWGLGVLVARKRAREPSDLFVFALAALLTLGAVALEFSPYSSSSLRHASTFFVAAFMQRCAGRIPLNKRLFAISVLVLVATALLAHGSFEIAYRLLLPYAVLYLAFVPGGLIRRYNVLGDYSYGIYIYAFPIQQMIASLQPDADVLALFGMATAATGVCAILSWHLIERPALALRDRIEGAPAPAQR